MRVGFWSAVAGAVSGMVGSGVSKFLTSKVNMLTPMAVNGLSGMVETVAENAVLGVKTNLIDLGLAFAASTTLPRVGNNIARNVKQLAGQGDVVLRHGDEVLENVVEQMDNIAKANGSSSLQDIANKTAQKYNAKYNPYEKAISKGYKKVKRTANGGVSFQGTEYIYYHNGQEARKVIQATGNRNNDFKMANQAMGLSETPDGYVWHHLDDYNVEKNTITMELVMDEAHNASKPHSGGCAQYDSVNGPTYNKKKKRGDK